MSDTSQGPGWWLASDGKWYPPQPAATPPPAPVPPPAAPLPPPVYGGAPGYTPAPMGPPPKKKGGNGCLIAFGIVFVICAILAGGLFFVLRKAGDVLEESVGGIGNCPIISTQQAQEVLGAGYTADELKGLLSLGSVALDTRVLADGQQCWITSSTSASGNGSSSTPTGRIVTVSRYQGGDAQTRFQTELTKSKGTSEDKGGGLSVESMAYFNKTVELGDEAFCTSSSLAGSSGVLVRKGTTLVYVSTTPNDFTSPGVDPSGTMSWDEENCQVSMKLAAKAIGG